MIQKELNISGNCSQSDHFCNKSYCWQSPKNKKDQNGKSPPMAYLHRGTNCTRVAQLPLIDAVSMVEVVWSDLVLCPSVLPLDSAWPLLKSLPPIFEDARRKNERPQKLKKASPFKRQAFKIKVLEQGSCWNKRRRRWLQKPCEEMLDLVYIVVIVENDSKIFNLFGGDLNLHRTLDHF